MHKNILIVIGIIILFLGVGFQSLLANNIDKPDVESKDNFDEIGTLDDYKEIITWIHGVLCGFDVIKEGLIRDMVMHAEVGIFCIYINGYRHSEGIFPVFFPVKHVEWLHAPRFLGITHYDGTLIRIRGIAFGDIEWTLKS